MSRIQPGVLAKPADRSMKRIVQPRELTPDGHCWKSPVGGQTRLRWATRRPFTLKGKASADRGWKGHENLLGTRGKASGMREKREEPWT